MKKSSLKPYIRSLRSILAANADELSAIGKRIIDATDDIHPSWSDSWIGWHANLYFRGYRHPQVTEMFDSEWGGLHKIDPGWRSITLDEMWEEVRLRTKLEFDLDGANDKLDEIVKAAKELKTQLELVVTNKTLKKKITDTTPGFSMMDYIHVRQPKQLWSRDSKAMAQGFHVPPHIQCAGFGQALRVDIDEANELLRLADIALKDDSGGLDPWRYTNPFWLAYRAGKVVVDFVIQNKVKALVGMVIAITGLIAADYAMAWRNLKWIIHTLGL